MKQNRTTKTVTVSSSEPIRSFNLLVDMLIEMKGKVIERSTDSATIKFGNEFVIRLFGTFILYDVLKKPLPSIVKIRANNSSNTVDITMSDNFYFGFRDSICKQSFDAYFNGLESSMFRVINSSNDSPRA